MGDAPKRIWVLPFVIENGLRHPASITTADFPGAVEYILASDLRAVKASSDAARAEGIRGGAGGGCGVGMDGLGF